MEKKNNMLVVMNVILMLLVIGLGVYLFVDKSSTKEPDKQPDSGTQTPSSTKDKLSESFTITVNGKKHNVKVNYKVNLSYKDDSDTQYFATYTATVYYDNQKFADYEYPFNKVVLTEQEAQKYTIDDFDERFSISDLYIIKGANKQEYIGVYDNMITQIGDISYLHVFDEQGKEIIKIADDTTTGIENYYYGDYQLTKVQTDSILFYAFREQDQLANQPINQSVVVEYKLTLGNTLKFEKLNTYTNASIAGGGDYFNDDIVSE